MLLPYLVANVVVALVWFWMLDYQLGIVNEVLHWHRHRPGRLLRRRRDWAIPTIALINVWRHMGYTALLLFAGLQTIPTHVYEAAAVDGASEWRMFWRITLPLLRPVLALVLVVTVDRLVPGLRHRRGHHAGRAGQRHPRHLLLHLRAGLHRFDFGYASALSSVLFVILAAGRLAAVPAAARAKASPT